MKNIQNILLILFLLMISLIAHAQPGGVPGGGGGGEPVGVPLDGGVTALVAAGLSYLGFRFFRRNGKGK